MPKEYNVSWIKLLEKFQEEGWLPCQELADSLDLEYWEVYRALIRMMRYNLVKRKKGPYDKRTLIYYVTKKGIDYIEFKGEN